MLRRVAGHLSRRESLSTKGGEVRRGGDQYSAGETQPEKVVFVLYDEPAYRAFKQELETQKG